MNTQRQKRFKKMHGDHMQSNKEVRKFRHLQRVANSSKQDNYKRNK